MTAAVASPSSAVPYQTFCGEGDSLLDALIAASVKKRIVAQPASFKALVPFDFGAFDADTLAKSPGGKHTPVAKNQRALPHPGGQAGTGPKRSKPAREAGKVRRRSPSPPKPAQKPASSGRSSPARFASPSAKSANVFAGPGFCNSPAPSALPMPTGALLARPAGPGSPASPGNPKYDSSAAAATNNLKRLLQVPVAA